MKTNIDEIEFTIFDTETTGLDPKSGDRIIEIAGVKFKGEKKIASFQTLVNPHRAVSEGAFAVNKISQEMLVGAPDFSKVAPEFRDFIKGSVLCSYNAAFDMGFVNNELELVGAGRLDEVMVVDILKMSRRLIPGLERYALWFVAEKLGLGAKQEHRAWSDVEITLGVFNKLKAIAENKHITEFGNFMGLFGITPRIVEDINNQKIAEIQEAIGMGVKLKIKYLAASSAEVSEREVIPKEIKQENNNSYLVGYCCLKNEERVFRVDGILHIEAV